MAERMIEPCRAIYMPRQDANGSSINNVMILNARAILGGRLALVALSFSGSLVHP